MKIIKPLLVLLLLCAGFLQAQVILPYAINAPGLPADSSTIPIALVPGGTVPGFFATHGFEDGDMAPDFSLYDSDGKLCSLSQLLGEGKPVLLVAVSYTCPVARKTMEEQLPDIRKKYGRKINIRLIYTVEAHPIAPDVCPYVGDLSINPADNKNRQDSVQFRQTRTYLQRKQMAEAFVKNFKLSVPVLIDSPNNAYWRNFGPAPDNAYLITPSGMVYKKYGWFSNPDISNDIKALLKNKALLKEDFNDKFSIEKSPGTGHAQLKMPEGAMYKIFLVNAGGQIAYANYNVHAPEFDLDAMMIAKGTYGLVIKVHGGSSYCARYVRS